MCIEISPISNFDFDASHVLTLFFNAYVFARFPCYHFFSSTEECYNITLLQLIDTVSLMRVIISRSLVLYLNSFQVSTSFAHAHLTLFRSTIHSWISKYVSFP